MDLQQALSVIELLFSNTPFMTFVVILVALFANIVVRVAERKPMRPIGAFDTLAEMTGASIESSRPLHVSIGSSTIGNETTMVALLGSEFIYYAAREVAIGDTAPLFTVSEGAALPLAVDTIRRAYEYENRVDAYNAYFPLSEKPISTRWYPAGRRSLAFAAALMTMQNDDDPVGNVLVGRYGIELSLILDSAYRNQRPAIATSDDLDGQAIAYALADDALIGEEVFAAPAYLSSGTHLQRRNFAIDVMRGLVVAAIIILVIYQLTIGG